MTVTATLANGYAWSRPAPAGWTEVNLTTARFTVSLVGASCTSVTPAAPTVVQAVCVDGALTVPTLTLPTTTGIAYTAVPSVPPAYAPGDTVVVTATLTGQGVGWPAPASMPPGWTIKTPTTAEFTVTFKTVSCTPATTVESGCGAGDVCGWCGDGAVGDADSGGGHLLQFEPAGAVQRGGGHGGDGDGGAGRRVRLDDSCAGWVDVCRLGHGEVHGDARRGVVHRDGAGGADGDSGGVSSAGCLSGDGDVADDDRDHLQRWPRRRRVFAGAEWW